MRGSENRGRSDRTEPAPKAWYENVWVAFLSGYVFAPLGIYLMWRYQTWPVWLKIALTAFGLIAMVVGTYLSTKYGPVHLF